MNSPTPQPANADDRLKTREYVGYALGDTASNFFFQTFAMFLTIYYTDVWGISAAVLVWLLPLVRIVGTLDDPIIGLIADRTNSRWGKFRPYLLWGAIPYGICGYLMFAGPNLGPTAKLVYAGVTYGLMMTCYSIVNVPYSSMLGVISPSSRTRAVASSFRFVGAFGGALLISLLVQPLEECLGGGNELRGWRWTMAIFAVASVAMFWVTFATTKERVTPPPQQKSNVREELGELFHNWPCMLILLSSLLAATYFCVRGGSTVYYYKYVVACPNFSERDIVDSQSLAAKLKQPGRPFDTWLSGQLTPATQKVLADSPGQESNRKSLQQALVRDLNKVIRGEAIYQEQRFDGIGLRSETKTLLAKNPEGIDLGRLNRLLIEDACPQELSRNPIMESDNTPLYQIGFLKFNRSTIFLSLGSLALMLGTAFVGRLVRRIDKKYYACVLSAVAGLSFASFFFLPKDNFGLQLAVGALSQLCAGPVAAITWALYGDVADYGEWKFGRRSTGLVYSASLFAIKTGVMLAGFLLPLFLDQFGFMANKVQTETAMLGITLAFSLLPGLCGLLNAVALLKFPLNQKHMDEIERELAARRVPAPSDLKPA